MNPDAKMCPNCAVPMYFGATPYSETRHREVWRCLRCKHEELGEVRAVEVHVEPEFTLRITWDTQSLETKALKSLREIDQRLGNLPVAEVLTTLRGLRCWDIPSLSHFRLHQLIDLCEAAGLAYEIR